MLRWPCPAPYRPYFHPGRRFCEIMGREQNQLLVKGGANLGISPNLISPQSSTPSPPHKIIYSPLSGAHPQLMGEHRLFWKPHVTRGCFIECFIVPLKALECFVSLTPHVWFRFFFCPLSLCIVGVNKVCRTEGSLPQTWLWCLHTWLSSNSFPSFLCFVLLFYLAYFGGLVLVVFMAYF